MRGIGGRQDGSIVEPAICRNLAMHGSDFAPICEERPNWDKLLSAFGGFQPGSFKVIQEWYNSTESLLIQRTIQQGGRSNRNDRLL